MKTTPVLALIAMALAAPVAAQEADPAVDVNGDGFYSFPELSAVAPDLTDEDFSAMDATGDGLLDMAEVAAAVDAGMLPPMEG